MAGAHSSLILAKLNTPHIAALYFTEKTSMSEQQIVYSFAWFQPEEWQKLKETVEDPETLDDTYQEWRHNAETVIKELRTDGHQVKKISIKISKLLDWCDSKGLKPNSKARSEYAAFLAEQRSK